MTIGRPKPFTWKSKKYLDYVRKQPCLICGYPSEAHHVKTKGAGGCDAWTVPLCRLHHSGCHHFGKDTFFERHGLDVYEELFKMTKGYIEANK